MVREITELFLEIKRKNSFVGQKAHYNFQFMKNYLFFYCKQILSSKWRKKFIKINDNELRALNDF